MSEIDDIAKRAKDLWEHEDNLINQRITWLSLFQGALFAAFALIHDEPDNTLQSALPFIPWFGILINLAILVGVYAAIRAMYIIRSRADENEVTEEKYPLRGLGVSDKTTSLGLVPPIAIPLLFLIAWMLLL